MTGVHLLKSICW